MIKVAANKYPGPCGECRADTPKGQGVYLKGHVLCGPCLQEFADDLATNKGRMVRPCKVPTRLLKWAIRENGIQGIDRLARLAAEWRANRVLGEILGS